MLQATVDGVYNTTSLWVGGTCGALTVRNPGFYPTTSWAALFTVTGGPAA